MRISDWSSDVCSSDLYGHPLKKTAQGLPRHCGSIAVIQGRPEGPNFCSPERNGAGMEADRRRRRFSALSGKNSPLRLQHVEPGFHRGVVVVTGRRTAVARRSEEHTSELQSLMRNSYAIFCCK